MDQCSRQVHEEGAEMTAHLARFLGLLLSLTTVVGCGYEGDVGLRVCDPSQGRILWSAKTHNLFIGMAVNNVEIGTANSDSVTIRNLSSGTTIRAIELGVEPGGGRELTMSPDLRWLLEGGMVAGHSDEGRPLKAVESADGCCRSDVRAFGENRSRLFDVHH
jgi:hypothetical protein